MEESSNLRYKHLLFKMLYNIIATRNIKKEMGIILSFVNFIIIAIFINFNERLSDDFVIFNDYHLKLFTNIESYKIMLGFIYLYTLKTILLLVLAFYATKYNSNYFSITFSKTIFNINSINTILIDKFTGLIILIVTSKFKFEISIVFKIINAIVFAIFILIMFVMGQVNSITFDEDFFSSFSNAFSKNNFRLKIIVIVSNVIYTTNSNFLVFCYLVNILVLGKIIYEAYDNSFLNKYNLYTNICISFYLTLLERLMSSIISKIHYNEYKAYYKDYYIPSIVVFSITFLFNQKNYFKKLELFYNKVFSISKYNSSELNNSYAIFEKGKFNDEKEYEEKIMMSIKKCPKNFLILIKSLLTLNDKANFENDYIIKGLLHTSIINSNINHKSKLKLFTKNTLNISKMNTKNANPYSNSSSNSNFNNKMEILNFLKYFVNEDENEKNQKSKNDNNSQNNINILSNEFLSLSSLIFKMKKYFEFENELNNTNKTKESYFIPILNLHGISSEDHGFLHLYFLIIINEMINITIFNFKNDFILNIFSIYYQIYYMGNYEKAFLKLEELNTYDLSFTQQYQIFCLKQIAKDSIISRSEYNLLAVQESKVLSDIDANYQDLFSNNLIRKLMSNRLELRYSKEILLESNGKKWSKTNFTPWSYLRLREVLLYDDYFSLLKKSILSSSNSKKKLWELLKSKTIYAKTLFNNLKEIIEDKKKCEKIWKEINMYCDNKPDSYFVKLYVNFQNFICNDVQASKEISDSIYKNIHHDYLSSDDIYNNRFKKDIGILTVSLITKNIGKITYVNDSLCEIVSYNKIHILDNNIKIILPEIIGNIHDDMITNFINKGKSHFIGKTNSILCLKNSNNFLVPIQFLVNILPSINSSEFLQGICLVRKKIILEEIIISEYSGRVDSMTQAMYETLKLKPNGEIGLFNIFPKLLELEEVKIDKEIQNKISNTLNINISDNLISQNIEKVNIFNNKIISMNTNANMDGNINNGSNNLTKNLSKEKNEYKKGKFLEDFKVKNFGSEKMINIPIEIPQNIEIFILYKIPLIFSYNIFNFKKIEFKTKLVIQVKEDKSNEENKQCSSAMVSKKNVSNYIFNNIVNPNSNIKIYDNIPNNDLKYDSSIIKNDLNKSSFIIQQEKSNYNLKDSALNNSNNLIHHTILTNINNTQINNTQLNDSISYKTLKGKSENVISVEDIYIDSYRNALDKSMLLFFELYIKVIKLHFIEQHNSPLLHEIIKNNFKNDSINKQSIFNINSFYTTFTTFSNFLNFIEQDIIKIIETYSKTMDFFFSNKIKEDMVEKIQNRSKSLLIEKINLSFKSNLLNASKIILKENPKIERKNSRKTADLEALKSNKNEAVYYIEKEMIFNHLGIRLNDIYNTKIRIITISKNKLEMNIKNHSINESEKEKLNSDAIVKEEENYEENQPLIKENNQNLGNKLDNSFNFRKKIILVVFYSIFSIIITVVNILSYLQIYDFYEGFFYSNEILLDKIVGINQIGKYSKVIFLENQYFSKLSYNKLQNLNETQVKSNFTIFSSDLFLLNETYNNKLLEKYTVLLQNSIKNQTSNQLSNFDDFFNVFSNIKANIVNFKGEIEEHSINEIESRLVFDSFKYLNDEKNNINSFRLKKDYLKSINRNYLSALFSRVNHCEIVLNKLADEKLANAKKIFFYVSFTCIIIMLIIIVLLFINMDSLKNFNLKLVNIVKYLTKEEIQNVLNIIKNFDNRFLEKENLINKSNENNYNVNSNNSMEMEIERAKDIEFEDNFNNLSMSDSYKSEKYMNDNIDIFNEQLQVIKDEKNKSMDSEIYYNNEVNPEIFHRFIVHKENYMLIFIIKFSILVLFLFISQGFQVFLSIKSNEYFSNVKDFFYFYNKAITKLNYIDDFPEVNYNNFMQHYQLLVVNKSHIPKENIRQDYYYRLFNSTANSIIDLTKFTNNYKSLFSDNISDLINTNLCSMNEERLLCKYVHYLNKFKLQFNNMNSSQLIIDEKNYLDDKINKYYILQGKGLKNALNYYLEFSMDISEFIKYSFDSFNIKNVNLFHSLISRFQEKRFIFEIILNLLDELMMNFKIKRSEDITGLKTNFIICSAAITIILIIVVLLISLDIILSVNGEMLFCQKLYNELPIDFIKKHESKITNI